MKPVTEFLRVRHPWPDYPQVPVGAVLVLTSRPEAGAALVAVTAEAEQCLVSEFYEAVRVTTLAIGAGFLVAVRDRTAVPKEPMADELLIRAGIAPERLERFIETRERIRRRAARRSP